MNPSSFLEKPLRRVTPSPYCTTLDYSEKCQTINVLTPLLFLHPFTILHTTLVDWEYLCLHRTVLHWTTLRRVTSSPCAQHYTKETSVTPSPYCIRSSHNFTLLNNTVLLWKYSCIHRTAYYFCRLRRVMPSTYCTTLYYIDKICPER